MSAEAWIALAALSLSVIGGVVYGCILIALMRRDVRSMKENHLPHILRVLDELPCRQPTADKTCVTRSKR